MYPLKTPMYPLKTPWTMWTNKICKLCDSNFNDKLMKIYKFDSVTSFWYVVNHIPKISELNYGIKYRMFRNDIKPWDDDAKNFGGGAWTFHIDVSIFNMKKEKHVDDIWERCMMSVIGGKLYGDLDSYVNGICCGQKCNNQRSSNRRSSNRRSNKQIRKKMFINLWIAACEPEKIKKIGKKIKEIMMGDKEFVEALERDSVHDSAHKCIAPLTYQDHAARYKKSGHKKSRYKKPRYHDAKYTIKW